jgi:catechol 2,3-dioxygenase-like lactoylglutathione lyase family enzyme
MTKWIAGLGLAFALMSGTALAQTFPANDMGVTMGHWHLNSKDVEANKKIFVAMGGTAVSNGNFNIVRFPGVIVFLNQGANAAPATGGTVGTVVNHVGFVVQNVQESMAKWKAAGVPVSPGNNGRLDQAYVNTADGLRIEILEDKNMPWPIRNEHVHFSVPESEIPKMQAWYAKEFGGHAWTRNNGAVVDLPGVQLRFAKSDTAQVSTKGHVLDHYGFDVKNLEAFVKKLAADGVKVDRPYTKNAQTGAALAFIYDPWGTYIELNERPNPL